MFRREIFIAFAVLLIASTVSGYSYRALLREREAAILPLQDLQIGITRLNLLSNDQCIGHLEYTFARSDEDSYSITGGGKIWVAYQGNQVEFKLSIEAFFNKLGQLGGSVFQLVAGKNQALIGSSGTNPIEVALKFQLDGSDRVERRIQVPGPITLKRLSSGNFQVHAQLLRSFGSTMKRIGDQPLLTALRLRTEPINERINCASGKVSGLALDPLVNMLKLLEGVTNPLLKELPH